MNARVCVCAGALCFPQGGGHLWAYLNWALGLRALGCQVIWLEGVVPGTPTRKVQANIAALKRSLAPYGFAESVALYSSSWGGEPLPPDVAEGCLGLEEACEADLLLNLSFGIPPEVVRRFPRTALVDIDPGQTQIWISEKEMDIARHDVYFTIGETVGQPGALFPDCGLQWEYTPPPVFLPAWAPTRTDTKAPYTTVTNWWGALMEFQGQSYYNGKRDGFLPFRDLPLRTTVPLELAIGGAAEDNDCETLRARGWRVCDAFEVASTPWEYQCYIQDSRGEFSCAKPCCVRLQNAWVSDRTLCYLASGKPAVVQHTGPSRFLPDSAGLFRFRDFEEAVRCLETVEADYEQQCKLARALAERYFDARKVLTEVLERAL